LNLIFETIPDSQIDFERELCGEFKCGNLVNSTGKVYVTAISRVKKPTLWNKVGFY